MGAQVIRHHIRHAFMQKEMIAIFKFADKRSFQAMNDMPFFAPMVSHVSFGVFDQTDAKSIELNGLPHGRPCFSRMFRFFNKAPVYCLKRYVGHCKDFFLSTAYKPVQTYDCMAFLQPVIVFLPNETIHLISDCFYN